MGGLDWAALPIVADFFGYEDIEILVAQLVAIRNHQNETRP